MGSEGDRERTLGVLLERGLARLLPRPTASFRRRAWLQFQRAIDPLAKPKPYRTGRR
jgi:hypothetical protein